MEPCVRVKKFLAFTFKEKQCYHTARWCGKIKREFWFTFDPMAVFGEIKGTMKGQFNARDLPEACKQDKNPIGWIGMAMSDGFDFKTITLES